MYRPKEFLVPNAPSTSSELTSPSVFVLEDSEVVQQALIKAFEIQNISSCFARSLEEAKDFLETKRLVPQCFLIEEVGTFERMRAFLEELSQSHPQSKRIVLTRSPAFAQKVEKLGLADLILKKPCSPERVFQAISNSLERELII